MADASRLRGLRRAGLGSPPTADEARGDLAPIPPPPETGETAVRPVRLDGRTMRRSNRTVQFATRVSPEFDEHIRRIAVRDKLLLVEVLERALDAYEHQQSRLIASILPKASS